MTQSSDSASSLEGSCFERRLKEGQLYAPVQFQILGCREIWCVYVGVGVLMPWKPHFTMLYNIGSPSWAMESGVCKVQSQAPALLCQLPPRSAPSPTTCLASALSAAVVPPPNEMAKTMLPFYPECSLT